MGSHWHVLGAQGGHWLQEMDGGQGHLQLSHLGLHRGGLAYLQTKSFGG